MMSLSENNSTSMTMTLMGFGLVQSCISMERCLFGDHDALKYLLIFELRTANMPFSQQLVAQVRPY
jgi:hypothetical protein